MIATVFQYLCGDLIIKYFIAFSGARTFVLGIRTVIAFYIMSMPYKGGFIKKIFLVMLGFTIIGIIDTALAIGLSSLNLVGYGNVSYIMENIVISLEASLLFLTALIIRRLRGRSQIVNKSNLLYLLEFSIVLISIVGLVLSFYVLDSEAVYVICLYSLVVIIFTYSVHSRLEIYYQKTQKLKLMNQRYRMYTEYYENLEQQQTEIRTIKHDLKNKLIVLSAYANKGETNMVKNEIQDLQKQLSGKV